MKTNAAAISSRKNINFGSRKTIAEPANKRQNSEKVLLYIKLNFPRKKTLILDPAKSHSSWE